MSLGQAGHTIVVSCYQNHRNDNEIQGYKDWAIERTPPDPISLSANLCSSVLMIFEGREVRSSVAFLLT